MFEAHFFRSQKWRRYERRLRRLFPRFQKELWFRACCPREGSGRLPLLTHQYHSTSLRCVKTFEEMEGLSCTATVVLSTIVSRTRRTLPFFISRLRLSCANTFDEIEMVGCVLHSHFGCVTHRKQSIPNDPFY